MNHTLKCILLIDDNPDDNFFHEREILKSNTGTTVITRESARDALEYLKTKESNDYCHPDLIFLDINMPGMNGWEFLEAYDKLDKEIQSRAIIIMLTTSDYFADVTKSKTWDFVSDFITKPLTKEMMKDITDKYFGK